MENLAKLAMLRNEDIKELKSEVEAFIEMAKILERIEEKTNVRKSGGMLREDTEEPSLEKGEVLKNAPAVKDGFFVVPKTFG